MNFQQQLKNSLKGKQDCKTKEQRNNKVNVWLFEIIPERCKCGLIQQTINQNVNVDLTLKYQSQPKWWFE